MSTHPIMLLSILVLISSFYLIHAQQPYIGQSSTNCELTGNSSSILGYTCNGQNSTCQSYLIFRSQPPYNSVASIAALLSSDPSQLSQVNGVGADSTFATNTEVIVPVNCSCSGEYYQADSFYVRQQDDTYFSIANNTFQGLSTCHTLQSQNSFPARNILVGTRIYIPLRCACPTRNQTGEGVNYLVSYPFTWGDSVRSVSSRFGVDNATTLAANELSVGDILFTFTTLLVPLQNPPNSQTILPSSPPPPPPPPPSATSPPGGRNSTRVYIIIGVVCAVGLALAVFAAVFCVYFRRRKSKAKSNKSAVDPILDSGSFESYEKTKSSEQSDDFLVSISEITQSLRIYKFGELQSATDSFSPKCLIKGSVYRGTINGNLAAIKKTNKDVTAEMNILDKLKHFNLIKLSGVCFSQGYWYLVYEHAMNGSLTEWIHYSKTSEKFLSWSQRIQIALDVASGLNYLHSYTNPPHVHKDVNTSNVLLDSDFRAKVANFRLARSAVGKEGDFASTRHIVGTKGYMAPGYLEDGYVSPKLDVYAFGIVMLEILTGKEISATGGTDQLFLPEALAVQEKLEDLLDPSLGGDYPLDSALLLARLIEKCLRREPGRRPAMDDVVRTLSAISSASLDWEAVKNVSDGKIN